ncbi:MAG: hypothetical protein GXX79_13830 [Actinomycetales bacterium]|nr:hypothetical protein [Actinomycetales bacterium]
MSAAFVIAVVVTVVVLAAAVAVVVNGTRPYVAPRPTPVDADRGTQAADVTADGGEVS